MEQEHDNNYSDNDLARSDKKLSNQKSAVQVCNTFSVTLEFHAKKIVIHHSLN
ncbi:MAG: hypothetical protein ACI9BD_001086 [Candidatus Marinamargulisbacteria bacterium]|jgi:hypothetical protein